MHSHHFSSEISLNQTISGLYFLLIFRVFSASFVTSLLRVKCCFMCNNDGFGMTHVLENHTWIEDKRRMSSVKSDPGGNPGMNWSLRGIPVALRCKYAHVNCTHSCLQHFSRQVVYLIFLIGIRPMKRDYIQCHRLTQSNICVIWFK